VWSLSTSRIPRLRLLHLLATLNPHMCVKGSHVGPPTYPQHAYCVWSTFLRSPSYYYYYCFLPEVCRQASMS
jgi:hypothetical protein